MLKHISAGAHRMVFDARVLTEFNRSMTTSAKRMRV